MVCFRGMLLPQTQSEAGKFCILETESCNLVNTFRCKFNKGDENKISVLQAQATQLCTMDEFHWRAGMIYRLLSPLVEHGRGYILKPPSINLHTWLSKQNAKRTGGCASRGILSVRCNAGPAEGPGENFEI